MAPLTDNFFTSVNSTTEEEAISFILKFNAHNDKKHAFFFNAFSQTPLLVWRITKADRKILSRTALKITLLAMLIMLVGSFGLWYFWYGLTNWGRWKQRGEGAPDYVKTTFGWITRAKYDARMAEKEMHESANRQPRIWRSVKADYSWVFWDPSGAKQKQYNEQQDRSWLRFLPRSFRDHPHGAVDPPPREHAHRNCPSKTEGTPVGQLDGQCMSDSLLNPHALLDHDSGTVRQRHVSRSHSHLLSSDHFSSIPAFAAATINPSLDSETESRLGASPELKAMEEGRSVSDCYYVPSCHECDCTIVRTPPRRCSGSPPPLSAQPTAEEMLYVPRKRKAKSEPRNFPLMRCTTAIRSQKPIQSTAIGNDHHAPQCPGSWVADDEISDIDVQIPASPTQPCALVSSLNNIADAKGRDGKGDGEEELAGYEAEDELDEEVSVRDIS